MLRLWDWGWILLIVGIFAQYFDHARRLAAKDRRIEELEHLLAEYRDHRMKVVDTDDVRELLPSPGDEGAENRGVDLHIDV